MLASLLDRLLRISWFETENTVLFLIDFVGICDFNDLLL